MPEKLEAIVPELLDSAGIPGLAAAVLADGRVVWTRGFGTRADGKHAVVDENTVFEAASLSKPVFAYLVLQMVDRGEIDLDVPLVRYLPDEALSQDQRYRRITPRMVLSHTTGLSNERIDREPLILAFDPGTRFGYSGEGFAYLQKVVERIAGLPLAGLMQERVFGPLGMTHSSYVWEERLAANHALGHDQFGSLRAPIKPALARAPSSLHTTARDYARFLQALLSEGTQDSRILGWMRSPQIEIEPGIAWGLGWALEGKGQRSLWHWGENSNTGYTAYAILDPSRRGGFVYLANSNAGLSILEPLLDALGGEHPGVRWIGYERYDAPKRRVRLQIAHVVETEGFAAGLRDLAELEKRYPADAFGEDLLNTLGYHFLEVGRVTDAVELFHRNAEEFPTSWNVWDSLGDAYAAAGRVEPAIQSYRRSLELNPQNRHATESIRSLVDQR
jgi:CubicO group peptidase (beta-lactamase class C family)